MLKTVVEKELREIIGSTKFAISFAVCSFLILLAFYVGATSYHTNVARYEAAKRENLKQLEGLTDWMNLQNNRIFLPPQPLESLVSGIANDIGRTTEVRGRGELLQDDTRYNEEPVFAVFRFLDIEFIFQIVLSLFAILFAFDMISGEKERGTLRLTFANPLPRTTYLTGKYLGSFLALAVPLVIPILLGAVLLVLMGVPMSPDEWMRLTMIVLAGYLYFCAFLAIGIAVSALTIRPSSAFLTLLVIWIFAVLILPRSAILIAGRMVDVPSVDDINAKKFQFSQQLWTEDRQKMAAFTPTAKGDMEQMIKEFQKFMETINDERDKKMNDFSSRLNEERANRQALQEAVAFGIARISPSASFSLAASTLAGTSLTLKDRYRESAQSYQQAFGKFMIEKTGMNPGGGVVFRIKVNDGEKPKPIDPQELPTFSYQSVTLAEALPPALPEMGVLVFFSIAFLAVAQFAFQRYDLR